MSPYQSTFTLADAGRLIQQTAGRIQVFTHAKPDGDAFGSTVALVGALELMGKTLSAHFVAPMPATLAAMPGGADIPVLDEHAKPTLPPADLYVLLDTGAWSQVGPVRRTLEANLEKTLILDHHLSGDVAAAHRYIDGQSSATAEIVAALIDRLLEGRGGLDAATPAMRDGLFVGIASDTGWFRFSSARPETHELAARLLRLGTDHADLYRRLEQMERPEKVALITRALESLQLYCEGRAAVMSLRNEDFVATGALQEETEKLIDIPQQIAGVEVIVMLSEKIEQREAGPQTITRLSFRSKAGPEAINVADLAGRFGGGGHARAAGAAIEAPLDEAAPRVIDALDEVACPA